MASEAIQNILQYRDTFTYNGIDHFYADDLYQLYDAFRFDPFIMLCNACEFGFMVGYKCKNPHAEPSHLEKLLKETREEAAELRLKLADYEMKMFKFGIDPNQ